MRKHSKRYREAIDIVDREAAYPPSEAVPMVKKMATAGFSESIELALALGIDPKQSDQGVRGSFALPNGTGKAVRVICFAEGDDAQAAKDAGAVEVGAQDLADRIQKEEWLDFDVAVAHPSMMKFVGKLGKVLGPKGLMPSPKSGTVTPNVAEAVREFAGGRIEFRNDNQGNVCVCVGNDTFEEQQLVENVEAFLRHVTSLRPATVKGQFIRTATLSSTMSPGVRLAV